jgi:hypothetical protein
MVNKEVLGREMTTTKCQNRAFSSHNIIIRHSIPASKIVDSHAMAKFSHDTTVVVDLWVGLWSVFWPWLTS